MTARPHRSLIVMLAAVGLAFAAAPATAQTPPAGPGTEAPGEEIVVTARRSGVPVWRVAGPNGTAVLVGSIGSVAAGTKWSPAPLDAALAKADRVMFPENASLGNIGLFSAVGALAKWRRQASLPRGRTLQAMTTPAQWARLTALRDRDVLRPGFERTHPYHLAIRLFRGGSPKRKTAPGAETYVRRFLKKNKTKRVPLPRADFKAIMAEYWAVPTDKHVACMMDAVAQAETGAAGVRARGDAMAARSGAWAARRVPEALAAGREDRPACWPFGGRFATAWEASLTPKIRGLLGTRRTTVAVVSLDSLGKPGGVLDDLVAAGFDVSGPRWKR